jgi:ubiquinone/menaquinone biosynthesis C-methylase UbiE
MSFKKNDNFHIETIKGFGDEWDYFKQDKFTDPEFSKIFSNYFSIFPFNLINKNSIGADIGCGSGRWSFFIAPMVKKLYCIDPSSKALDISKSNLQKNKNCIFLNENTSSLSIDDNSLDFAYSLGVLHHIPNTLEALINCTNKLKNGSPFLIYLYYNFENRSFLFKFIWKITDFLRTIISLFPFKIKRIITDLIAIVIYYPLARFVKLASLLKIDLSSIPLSFYKNKSFYTMRTDSLDRFGTQIEQRFSKNEIYNMMKKSNLINISFHNKEPFWIAVGYKK